MRYYDSVTIPNTAMAAANGRIITLKRMCSVSTAIELTERAASTRGDSRCRSRSQMASAAFCSYVRRLHGLDPFFYKNKRLQMHVCAHRSECMNLLKYSECRHINKCTMPLPMTSTKVSVNLRARNVEGRPPPSSKVTRSFPIE